MWGVTEQAGGPSEDGSFMMGAWRKEPETSCVCQKGTAELRPGDEQQLAECRPQSRGQAHIRSQNQKRAGSGVPLGAGCKSFVTGKRFLEQLPEEWCSF